MITSIINVMNGNGMYFVFCAVDDVGGDTFQIPENNLSSEYETRTDSQGTLCTGNVFIFIIIVIHSFPCHFSFGSQGPWHETK